MDTFAPRGQIRGMIMPDYVEQSQTLCIEARYLYAVLCDYARDKDHCWPSQRTLARRLGCSIASLKKYLRQLVAEKLILIHRVLRGCRYYLLKPVQAVKKFSQKVSKFDGYPSNFDTKANLKNKKKEYTPPPLPHPVRMPDLRDGDAAFSQVWAIYPKQEAEARARNVWRKLWRQHKLPAISAVLEAIKIQARENPSWQRENGRFVPLLHNWLQDARWADKTQAQKATENAARQLFADEKRRKAERHAVKHSIPPKINDKEFTDFANRMHMDGNALSAAYAIFCHAKNRGVNIDLKTYNENSGNILTWMRRKMGF